MTENGSEVSLGRLIARWVERVLLGAVVLCVATYAVDLATFFLRSSPMDQITVSRTLAVPLKGNKTEFDYQGASIVTCSQSLFPQGGKTPCWYLRRHTTQIVPL